MNFKNVKFKEYDNFSELYAEITNGSNLYFPNICSNENKLTYGNFCSYTNKNNVMFEFYVIAYEGNPFCFYALEVYDDEYELYDSYQFFNKEITEKVYEYLNTLLIRELDSSIFNDCINMQEFELFLKNNC